jgi:hypothetical protein
MAKVLNSAMVSLGTSISDVYTASGKTMTLLIQAVNTHTSDVTVELWITDGSNVNKACCFPSQSIASYDGVTDISKHILPDGYKIRGMADEASVVYVEVSVVEGV